MENIKEKVDRIMETAKIEAVTVFDRALYMMATLEDGTVILEHHETVSPVVFDKAKSEEICLRAIYSRLYEIVNDPYRMSEEQAKIIKSFAENNQSIKEAAKDLSSSESKLRRRIATIKEQTGKDPFNFMDLCQLLSEAIEVLPDSAQ